MPLDAIRCNRTAIGPQSYLSESNQMPLDAIRCNRTAIGPQSYLSELERGPNELAAGQVNDQGSDVLWPDVAQGLA